MRNSIFHKVLCGLLGLYLFNVSVDTADSNLSYVPEDLSFNDQESIVEMIVEQLPGYEDAIEEYDDNDSEKNSKKKNTKIDLFVQQQAAVQEDLEPPLAMVVQSSLPYDECLISGFKKHETLLALSSIKPLLMVTLIW